MALPPPDYKRIESVLTACCPAEIKFEFVRPDIWVSYGE